MTGTITTVARKEWRDSIRDRRSLTAALMFAILGPLLVAGMITITADRETSDDPFEVVVDGAEYASDLSAYLQRNRVEFVADGAGVALSIPEDYAERFTDGRSVTLIISADRSKSDQRREAQRLEGLIHRYGAELGQTRLLLRGVAPSVVRPLLVEVHDRATREGRASLVLGILIIYFLLAPFVGSMAVCIDVSAGERERNSLEVLVAQPVSSTGLFAGKWLIGTVFGVIGVAMTVVASKLAFIKVPLAKIGMSWTMTATTMAQIGLSLVSLAALVAALQIALAMWAKTYKEASTYLSMLSFVPAALAAYLVVQEVESAPWMYLVPLLGHQQVLRTIIRAEPLDPINVAVLTIATLALTVVLIWFGGRLLTKEKIVFGSSE